MKRLLRMSYLAAGVAGLGFFAMSVLLLAIWPGRVLEKQIGRTSPPHPLPLTDAERRGRAIYGQNGCPYCHTQQIRYLDRDVKRFGAATLAWETIFDYPHLWGTRRIGPDLSREGSVRSTDWEFAHLYNPRRMTPDSVMPPFAWLFDGAPDRPTQGGRDLVAYLQTLGRNRELAGPEGEAHARASCECSEDEKRLAFESPVLNANPAKTREGDYPQLASSQDLNRGLQLFARSCANCHGKRGEGNGPGAAGLHPAPTNLQEHEYTPGELARSLWNGVPGTSMPAWRDWTRRDLAAVAQAVRSFHSEAAGPDVPSPDLLNLGAKVYAENCAQCHGEKGAGDGPASNRFPIAASNFRGERASFEAASRAVREGVEGTSMPPWTSRLSSDEITAVAYTVRGFFQR